MKRIIALIIFACMLLACAGCETNGSDNESKDKNTVITTDSDKGDSADGEELDSGNEENKTDSDVAESEESNSTEISDNHAPDFEIIDWNGNKIRLSSLFGKPIVLNFWASGCGPCRNEMPDFQEAYKKYGDDVQFMMVNYIGFFGETIESAKSFINDQGYTFPVYFDTENSAAAIYGIYSIPQTFFIGANGEVVAYGQGMLDAAALEQGISMIID